MKHQHGGIAKGCLIAFGLLIGAGILGIGLVCTLAVASSHHDASAFNSMTPAQHLEAAKGCARSKAFTTMQVHLDAVPDGTPGKAEFIANMKIEKEKTEKENAVAAKAEEEADAKALKFIEKTWMRGNGRLFSKFEQSKSGGVYVMAEPGWYFAHLNEKKLACGAIWAYYFRDGHDDYALVMVQDSRTGKDLATFTKALGLQMEN